MPNLKMCLVAVLTAGIGWLAQDDKPEPRARDKVTNSLLRKEPMTIVFRQIVEPEPLDRPWRWSWSINTAGQAELIITGSPKGRRVKKKFSAQQMASIRQTLCDERFVDLEDAYGPLVIHGGWSTLEVFKERKGMAEALKAIQK